MERWRTLLFSIYGRISRRDFWIGYLIINAFVAIIGVVLLLCLDVDINANQSWELAITLVLLFPIISLCKKRLHDHNRSSRWLLIILIPIVGQLLLLIYLGFIRGTVGTNLYGPDPVLSKASH